MAKRIHQLFASQHMAPDLSVASIDLSKDARDGSYILTVAGLRYPRACSGRPRRVSMRMDRDEATGLEDWLYLTWMAAPPRVAGTHFRSIYPLRSGKLVGIETFDGERFLFLGGEMPPHEWDIEWQVQGDASRDDLGVLMDVLAALRESDAHPATREESRP